MVETITPAGCGGRHKRTFAVILFTLGAIAGAAAVGALAGAAGALIPSPRWRTTLAIGVVAAALAREAGLVRMPVPALHRQVPETWRRRLPLPLWTTGYGAILGTGLGTYQPTATLWATLAAIIATGNVLVAMLCMAVFGLARGLMILVPVARLVDATRIGRPPLRSANVAVLTAVLVALVPQVAWAQMPMLIGTADPSVSGSTTAVTTYGPGGPAVVVRPAGEAPITIAGTREPSLSTQAIALVTDAGVEVRLWRTGQIVLTVPGARHPSLNGRYLAYVERTPRGSRLILRDIGSGDTTVVAQVAPGVDLGRAAFSGRRMAWHEASGLTSRILLWTIGTPRATIISQTRRRQQAISPALARGRLVWVESDAERSWLVTRRLDSSRRRVIATSGRGELFTTTATDGTRAWVTGWRIDTTSARVLSVPLEG